MPLTSRREAANALSKPTRSILDCSRCSAVPSLSMMPIVLIVQYLSLTVFFRINPENEVFSHCSCYSLPLQLICLCHTKNSELLCSLCGFSNLGIMLSVCKGQCMSRGYLQRASDMWTLSYEDWRWLPGVSKTSGLYLREFFYMPKLESQKAGYEYDNESGALCTVSFY